MKRKTVRLISLFLIAAMLVGIPFVTAQNRSSTTAGRQAARRPNVVFILGDDLVWMAST